MNLQLHLVLRITLVALLCLLGIAGYLLYQSHRLAEQSTQQIAESLAMQLESQLRLKQAGLGLSHAFPDFEVWKQSGTQPGICVLYTSVEKSQSRSLCNGSKPSVANWPQRFESVYRWIFNPGKQTERPISLDDQLYGSLSVTRNAETEIEAAWHKISDLMVLSTITVLAVCLLVYLNIRRTLRPANIIVSGLHELASGRLAFRLPSFELWEWQQITTAINQLAINQQQLLEERQQLLVKLLNLQEEERRYLARELHDEQGQCLTAINAYISSIKQTAIENCPQLLTEIDQINGISAHMMDSMHNLLLRLRPAELDELGLAASLQSMVAGWNARSKGATRFQLSIAGDCALLTATQAMHLFRIVQECLTNTAKHAAASGVDIQLSINAQIVKLIIKDNGVAKQLPFPNSGGIGLLGIRERVCALHGQLSLAIVDPQGLSVTVELPINAAAEIRL